MKQSKPIQKRSTVAIKSHVRTGQASKITVMGRIAGGSLASKLAAFVVVGVIGLVALHFTYADSKSNTMFVFGDSITARYNDNSQSPDQGWWSMTAKQLKLTPVTSAISGTGFNMRTGCKQPNYKDRLKDPTVQGQVAAAKMVLIEGGRNDYHLCSAAGVDTPASPYAVNLGSQIFFDQLVRYHPDRTSVYVMTPWGPQFADRRAWIIPIIRAQALAHGFNWIDTTGVLQTANTVDNTHPNHQGNVDLYNSVISNASVRRQTIR